MIGYIRLMSQVGTIALILLIVLIIAAVLYLYLQEKKRKERAKKRAEERRKRREEALAKMREEEENGTAFKRAMEERNQVRTENPRQELRKKDIDTLTNVRVNDPDTNVFQTGKHRFSTGKIGVVAEQPAEQPVQKPAPAAAPVVETAPVAAAAPVAPAPVYEAPAPTPAPAPEPVKEETPAFVETPKPVIEPVVEPVVEKASEEVLSEENRRFDFRKWASQLDEEIEVEKPVYIESVQEEKEPAEDELTFEVIRDEYTQPAAMVEEETEKEITEEISAIPSFSARPVASQPAPAPVQKSAPAPVFVQTPVTPAPAPAPAPAPVPAVTPAPAPAPVQRAAESAVAVAPRVSESAYSVLQTVEEDHSAKEQEFDDITAVAPIIRQQLDENKKPDIVDEVLNIPPTKPAPVDIPPVKPAAVEIPAVKPAAPVEQAPVRAPQEEIEEVEDYEEEDEEDYYDPDDPETIRLKKIALRRAEREARMKEKERYAAELAGVEVPETGYDEDDDEDEDYDEEDYDDETAEEKGGALRVVLWIIAALLSLFCVGAILYLMFGDFISGLLGAEGPVTMVTLYGETLPLHIPPIM